MGESRSRGTQRPDRSSPWRWPGWMSQRQTAVGYRILRDSAPIIHVGRAAGAAIARPGADAVCA